MTVSTTENRITYDGNGVSTVFNFPYKFLATTDLQVYVNGVLQTLTTHYSVGTPSDGGANVTFVTAPSVGDANIVILRDVDTLQESELPSNGPFPSSTVEQMVDKITLQVQRLRDLVSRAITLSDADSSTASTTLPSPEAGTLLGWNDALTGLQNVDPADLLTVAGSSGFSYQTFNGTGAQLNFTLNENPGAIANLSVFISGVRQTPVTDYTVAGTTLTFIAAPALGTNNILAVWGTTLGIGVPSDTSVTISKLPDGVFTGASGLAKFADGFMTLVKLATDLFNSATTVTLASGDKIVIADVSDSGKTKVALASDITSVVASASDTVQGKVELATNAEAAAGTDATRAVTPASLFGGLNASGTAPIYACRSWVNFNGTGTVAIRASGNVSSITDNGAGVWTVNFTTAMQDANASISVAGGPIASATTTYSFGAESITASSAQVICQRADGSDTDVSNMCVQAFR